jgi:hypothetical protein
MPQNQFLVKQSQRGANRNTQTLFFNIFLPLKNIFQNTQRKIRSNYKNIDSSITFFLQNTTNNLITELYLYVQNSF